MNYRQPNPVTIPNLWFTVFSATLAAMLVGAFLSFVFSLVIMKGMAESIRQETQPDGIRKGR